MNLRTVLQSALLGITAGLLATSPLAAQSRNPYDNSHSAVGMNLIWVTEWESMMPFIDAFKKARPWTANTGALDLDAQGWVRSLGAGQTALTTLMAPNQASQQALAQKFPSGDYLVTYDGLGTLSFLGSAVTQVQTLQPGRRLVTLDFSNPNANFMLRLDATDAGNYLRNLRVHLPGGVCNHDPFHFAANAQECTQIGATYESHEQVRDEFLFYAPFLNNLKHFRTLRYLQPLGINGSTVTEAAGLRSFDAATWWGQIPIEVVTRLANTLGSDVWLNLQTRASDALIQQLAQRLHADLHPSLKVYVELSNEVWNGVYPYSTHAQYLAAAGCARYGDLTQCDVDATPGNGIYCEGYPWPNQIADCTTARNRYFSDRTVEAGQIFIDVFGGRERLIRVMGGWNQPSYNRSLLEHGNHYLNVDALAMPTYFGGYIPSNLNNGQILQSWIDSSGQAVAMDRLFQEILDGGQLRPYYLPGGIYYDANRPSWQLPPANGALGALRDSLAANVALAQEFGLAAVSYEGGAHLDVTVNANTTGVRDLILAANRDPRMGTAYQRYLQDWRDLGGQMLMLYVSHSSSSGFGMVEYELQPHAQQPRLLAVQQFIDDNPCWWAGCAPELFSSGFE